MREFVCASGVRYTARARACGCRPTALRRESDAVPANARPTSAMTTHKEKTVTRPVDQPAHRARMEIVRRQRVGLGLVALAVLAWRLAHVPLGWWFPAGWWRLW